MISFYSQIAAEILMFIDNKSLLFFFPSGVFRCDCILVLETRECKTLFGNPCWSMHRQLMLMD